MTRASLLLLLVLAACSKPPKPVPDAARPRPVADASPPAAAVDPRVKAARAAVTRIGDAICACSDETCARRPLANRLMWEGELLLKDSTEEGRALIRAVQADPEVKAQQRRMDECTGRIRAAPEVAAQAARSWLVAVGKGDAAAIAAASTDKLWVGGWGCPSDAKGPAVAACIVKETAFARDVARQFDATSELTVETMRGRDLPGWARGGGLEELGADHEVVSVSYFGEGRYHELLLAVTRDGKVAAVLWQAETPD